MEKKFGLIFENFANLFTDLHLDIIFLHNEMVTDSQIYYHMFPNGISIWKCDSKSKKMNIQNTETKRKRYHTAHRLFIYLVMVVDRGSHERIRNAFNDSTIQRYYGFQFCLPHFDQRSNEFNTRSYQCRSTLGILGSLQC